LLKQTLFVDITLDKPRKLRFDLNFIAELEEIYDKPLQKIMEIYADQEKEGFGFRDLRKVVLAAVRHEEPGMTLKGIGTLLMGQDLEKLTETIMNALSAAIAGPEAAEGKGGNVESPESSGTGKKRGGTRSVRSPSAIKSSSG
tara:strand:- start:114 stop:542 length:429 start_codon:yes stop_codon:yes gene_type:complete